MVNSLGLVYGFWNDRLAVARMMSCWQWHHNIEPNILSKGRNKRGPNMNLHTKTLLDGTQIKNYINIHSRLFVFVSLTQLMMILY